MSIITKEEHKKIAQILGFVNQFYVRLTLDTTKPKTKRLTKRQISIAKLIRKLNCFMDDEFLNMHYPNIEPRESPYYGVFNGEEWHNKPLSEWNITEKLE